MKLGWDRTILAKENEDINVIKSKKALQLAYQAALLKQIKHNTTRNNCFKTHEENPLPPLSLDNVIANVSILRRKKDIQYIQPVFLQDQIKHFSNSRLVHSKKTNVFFPQEENMAAGHPSTKYIKKQCFPHLPFNSLLINEYKGKDTKAASRSGSLLRGIKLHQNLELLHQRLQNIQADIKSNTSEFHQTLEATGNDIKSRFSKVTIESSKL